MNLLKTQGSDHSGMLLFLAPLSQAAKLAVPTKTDSATLRQSTNQGLGLQLLPEGRASMAQ